MTAAPELVAIALHPIDLLVRAIVDLARGCLGHPGCRYDLPAVPHALLQTQLPEARDAFRRGAQPEAASIDAARAGFPGCLFNAQRLKQTRLEVVE
jgi:hypothetical protein